VPCPQSAKTDCALAPLPCVTLSPLNYQDNARITKFRPMILRAGDRLTHIQNAFVHYSASGPPCIVYATSLAALAKSPSMRSFHDPIPLRLARRGALVPGPRSLVNMTLFLAALTFMYNSARVASDSEYRSNFVEPLIADLKLTMLARNRYRYNSPTLSHRLNRERSMQSGSL
jgi:hypothetical protein